ncbi:hypothetical protein [Paraburkholderia sp. BL21I4N1]|uniref:hypothetical protein n=1 Tax=Paraburkholderia sp. BL21I4N1 TaxID=1938801 RepID=UPI000CFDF930|nr:hypothetical protein [Paraburkholderia sp. BL21I4N1]PQV49117.1 hypothetical protein B0G83_10762 [Paraburkholderia sp. BL21I4N1]
MKSLKQLMIVASIAILPTLSFAQPVDAQGHTGANLPAVSGFATHANQPATASTSQQALRNGSEYGDNTGYGSSTAGSTQSSVPSATPFIGKHSPVFNH